MPIGKIGYGAGDCWNSKVAVQGVILNKPRGCCNRSRGFILEPLDYQSVGVAGTASYRERVDPDWPKYHHKQEPFVRKGESRSRSKKPVQLAKAQVLEFNRVCCITMPKTNFWALFRHFFSILSKKVQFYARVSMIKSMTLHMYMW